MKQRPSFFYQPMIHTIDSILLNNLLICLCLFHQYNVINLTSRVHPVEFFADLQGDLKLLHPDVGLFEHLVNIFLVDVHDLLHDTSLR